MVSQEKLFGSHIEQSWQREQWKNNSLTRFLKVSCGSSTKLRSQILLCVYEVKKSTKYINDNKSKNGEDQDDGIMELKKKTSLRINRGV